MAMTKAQRVARAKKAARTRWDNASADDRNKQHLTMISAQARKHGYVLVPITESNEENESQ